MADTPATPEMKSRKGTQIEFILDSFSEFIGSAEFMWGLDGIREQILDGAEKFETEFPDAKTIYVVVERGWEKVGLTDVKPEPHIFVAVLFVEEDKDPGNKLKGN